MPKPKQQSNILAADVVEYTRFVMKTLEQLPWTEPIVNLIHKYGVCEDTRNRAFEARFGYLLHQACLVPEIDYQAGVRNTDIDFCIPGEPAILAELVCIEETRFINQDTVETVIDKGIVLREVVMSSDSEKLHLQPGSEINQFKLKVKRKVFDEKKGVEKKFPDPTDQLQIIIVNDQGLSDGLFREEKMQAIYGVVPLKKNGYPASTVDGQDVTGILEDEDMGAQLVQKRIHAIGVMTEYFEDGVYKTRLELFTNPALIDPETLERQWPLSDVIPTSFYGPDSKFDLDTGHLGWKQLEISHP